MYIRAWTTTGAMEAKTKYKCTHAYVKVMLGAFTIIQLALASLASAFEDAKEEDRTAIQREALHDQVYVFVCTYAFIPRILVDNIHSARRRYVYSDTFIRTCIHRRCYNEWPQRPRSRKGTAPLTGSVAVPLKQQ